ncbi:MAG: hypothetical protein HY721_25640, partial [Planctomycetes bacterium]|nr:hypothetical protein [Planctomycetota bacterium]
MTVASSGTDPNGKFMLPFAEGTFDLLVDPWSLPPGFLAPPPKSVVVSGSSITIDGSPVSGVYELVVAQSGVSLQGRVLQGDGSPVPWAFVQIVD